MGPIITLKRGKLEKVASDIIEHGKLTDVTPRAEDLVRIWETPEGGFLIQFPEGIHAYDFCNLVGWLNDPPGNTGSLGAVGWFSNDAEEFFFVKDPTNQYGDTLIGVTSTGKKVCVYLPENSISENPQIDLRYQDPPGVPHGQPAMEFLYNAEALGENMNPKLSVYTELAADGKPKRSGCIGVLMVLLLGLSLFLLAM